VAAAVTLRNDFESEWWLAEPTRVLLYSERNAGDAVGRDRA
jgi:hypothetical protein